ncbi:MAG: hypothetical protein IJD71_02585 [Clostridia bacterium]|nr:hypothetical protein [Clostridia bacterium]MBQ9920417.1 hypothetical protein [Clostridia bacterium]
MKHFLNRALTALISLLICLAIFLTVMFLTLSPYKTSEIAVTKQQQEIGYYTQSIAISASILIDIETCPTLFLAKLTTKNQKITVFCKPKKCMSQTDDNLDCFNKSEYQRYIRLTALQLDDITNYLGGIELETPYGLPSPANTNTLIAKDERTLVYGASLSALICKEKEPSVTKMAYCCYVLSEICLKFLKNCDTDYYKFLKNNSETDISYADFYDNFKALRDTIKYTDYICVKGKWRNGVFYFQ